MTTPGAELRLSGATPPATPARDRATSGAARYVAANAAQESSAASRATRCPIPPGRARLSTWASLTSGWLAPAIARSSSQSGAPFTQYALAPAAIIALATSESSEPAKATTRAVGNTSRIFFVASIPSRPGIPTSIRITSGESSTAFATASSPLAASPTTSISASSPSMVRTTLRASAESSQIRSRIIAISLQLNSPQIRSRYRTLRGGLNRQAASDLRRLC